MSIGKSGTTLGGNGKIAVDSKKVLRSLPKRETKRQQQYCRVLMLYVTLPIILLCVCYFVQPSKDPLQQKENDKIKQSAFEETEKDTLRIYEKFWRPAEKSLIDFVLREDRDISNGVLAMIYLPTCIYCKKLAQQLARNYDETSNSTILWRNVTFAAVNSDQLSTEFKSKHKIEVFPTLLLLTTVKIDASTTDKSRSIMVHTYTGSPLIRHALGRLQDWFQKLDYKTRAENLDLDDEMPIPAMSTEEQARSFLRSNTSLLNPVSNAKVAYSISKSLLPLVEETTQDMMTWKPYFFIDDLNESQSYEVTVPMEEKSAEDTNPNESGNNPEDAVEDDVTTKAEVTITRETPYFITRYVMQSVDVVPRKLVDAPITRTFESADEARTKLSQLVNQLQVPVLSRLYPESFDAHLRVTPAVLVMNQPVVDQESLRSIQTAFESFEYGIQFLYMYPYDHPTEAAKWFGFSTQHKQFQASLYIKKRGYTRFTGSLEDPQEIIAFVVKVLSSSAGKTTEEMEPAESSEANVDEEPKTVF